jgi:hypothetical protein
MKKLVFFISFAFFSNSLSAQLEPVRCLQVKNGIFVYRDDSSNAILVKRTGNLQEERIKKSGIVTRFKIRWQSDCSYEMTQVWSNHKTRRKNNGSITIVTITNVRQDGYEYSCGCTEPAGAQKNRGIMYRVE